MPKGRGVSRSRGEGADVRLRLTSGDQAVIAPAFTSVTRKALLRRLVESEATVVVLSAAAGAGKTTVLRQWAQRDDREHLVLRAGGDVDDPAVLAWRLLDLLEPLGDDASGAARAAVTTSEPRLSAVLLPTLTWLAASRSTPYVLVVDDAHLITDPVCHEFLARVCEGVPPESCVVLAMRSDTPVWLSRARVSGALLEMGPESFAFSQDEAAQLFAGMGVTPTQARIGPAMEATEGLAVGLYLSALAAANSHPHTPDGSASLRERYLDDYLRAEVLDDLDPDTLRFLTRTSILDEMTGPLCNAVTATKGGQARLEALHRKLQLVIDLGGTPRRFRLHHLLGESALALLREQEPGLEPELHRRAARWFDEAGLLDAAIQHAKAAGDLALIGSLIWSDVAANVGGGRAEQLRYRLSGLSDRQLASDRWLSLEACWRYLQAADVEPATKWLLRSQASVGADWRERVRTDAYAAQLALPTALVGSVGLADTVALCDDALEGLAPDDPLRAGVLFLRGASLTLLRDLREGVAGLEEAERYARALDVPAIIADSLAFRGVVALLTGDATSAARLIAGGTDIIRTHHLERLATAMHTLTAQALLQAMRGDDEAAQTLARARRMTVAGSGMTTWFAVVGRLVQARAAVLLGDGGTARVLVTEAREHMTAELVPSLAADLLADTEAAMLALEVNGVSGDSLTTAELRVLQFLPSHLSFPQIGEHLSVSTNTVKSHVMAIYRKFGATSRADAVARAQQLGLVERTLHDGPSSR